MMNKEIIICNEIGEKYIKSIHKSGLKIYICEKPEFSGAYAVFGTKYGSVDNAFKLNSETDFTLVPNGIAHFLEHKLFESEDGDAFSRFAKTGASANAYTSFDRTCYLFTCTDNFAQSFEILLDFVQKPYFTQETVDKEQGIIGQEISMYDDNADWMLFFNLLCSLYHNNPVKINIAGTAESISKIDASLLYKCYRTFYNLNNMFIVVSGNVNADDVLNTVDKMLIESEKKEIVRKNFDEPESVARTVFTQEMEVAMPQFALGYKMVCPDGGYCSSKDRIETQMLMELIGGKQSSLYGRLLKSGLINKSFSAELFEGRGYAAEMFTGQSNDPKAVETEIKSEIQKLIINGINEDDFNSVKKMFWGRSIMSFNDIENIGDGLTLSACSDEGLFDEISIIKEVTPGNLEERLKVQFLPEFSSLSLIVPKR